MWGIQWSYEMCSRKLKGQVEKEYYNVSLFASWIHRGDIPKITQRYLMWGSSKLIALNRILSIPGLNYLYPILHL